MGNGVQGGPSDPQVEDGGGGLGSRELEFTGDMAERPSTDLQGPPRGVISLPMEEDM